MSIKIDLKKCIGCGKCIEACPGNLISKSDNLKVFIRYPKECWGCCACIKECNFEAIKYYLGADIGGKGAYLNIRKEKDVLYWHIFKQNSEDITITTNAAEGNKY